MNALFPTAPAFKVGDMVYFGRIYGEKTLGKIKKVNPKKYKIEQMEDRGSIRDYKIGTIWTVPFNLVSAAPGTVAAPVASAPAVTAPVATFPVGTPVTYRLGTRTLNGIVVEVDVGRDNTNAEVANIGGLFSSAVRVGDLTHAPKRTSAAILADIRKMYSALSPENLHCDGEISRAQARSREVNYKRILRALFAEIGRNVSESEAFRKVSA